MSRILTQPVQYLRQLWSQKGTATMAAGLVFFQSLPSSNFSVRQPVVELPEHIQALMTGTSPRKVIVLYKDEVSESDISTLENNGASITHTNSLIPAFSGVLSPSQIGQLARSGRIQDIVADYTVTAFLDETIPQIGADTVHNAGVTGVGARVCIVDTGVDDSHPALPTLVDEYDFVNNDNDATDDHQHGTHVAGIVASQDPTYTGTAPGVSLMAAKVLNSRGSGSASEVMAGIEWCVTHDADVISMSLGGGASIDACDDDPLAQAANAAVDAGVVVLAASGNSGRSNRIASPSCASKVISVGSVDKNDVIASYSNGGSELDVTAPGSSVYSTVPGGGFTYLSGTSMATPHASGVAAIIRSILPDATPEQVRTMLRESAVDLGPAGFDFAYGYGRVDANAAYLYALNGPPPPPPPPPPSEDIYFDDFQSSFSGNWTNDGVKNWEIRSPAEQQVPGASAGNTVAHADDCDNGCTITSVPPLNLSSYIGAELSFWRFVDSSLDNGEFLRVQIFDGLLWNTVYEWTNGSGDDDIWHKETFDLSSKYQSDDIQIRFVTNQSSSIEEVEIDDVLIKGFLEESSAPTAHAGEDMSVSDSDGTGSESVTLDGSSSTDDGTIVSYEWKNNNVVIGTDPVLIHDFAIGTHLVSLTVTDDENETDTDTVEVVVHANVPPTANAGADQNLSDSDANGTEEVTLIAALSSDSDGTIESYEWKNEGSTVGTGSTLELVLAEGVHTYELTVTDNGGAVDTDSVTVTVSPNAAPIANAGADQLLGDSDDSGAEDTVLDGTASSDDGVIVTYVWTQSGTTLGTGSTIPATFTLGVHEVTLTVTDDTDQTSQDTVIVTVTANAAPTADAGEDQAVVDADNSGTESVTLSASNSSDVDGVLTSYEWKQGEVILGTDEELIHAFAIGEHDITLTVTDDGGLSDTDTVHVSVTAAPPAPSVPFEDGFESGLGNWSVAGGGFVVENQNFFNLVPGHVQGNAVLHGDDCDSPCTASLASPLDLTGYQNAALSFWRFVDRGLDAGEYLRIEVFNGSAWTTLAEWTDGSGDDNEWQYVTYDITPYLNANFNLRFVTKQSSSLEEVEVDDLIIQGLSF